MISASKKLFGVFKKLGSDRRGSTAIAMAILTPIIIAGLAFGSEAGFWELTHRRLQNAADSSVFAAGTQLRSGLDEDDMKAAALSVANESGFNLALYETLNKSGTNGTLTLTSPPTSGSYAGDSTAIHVVLSTDLNRRFTKIFASGMVTIATEATAVVQNGRPACILALHPSADEAVDITGSTTVTLDGCDVAANSISDSAFSQSGSGVISTDCISTVGGSDIQKSENVTLNDCSEPIENSPVTADPYRYRSEPSGHEAMACSNKNEWTANNGAPDSGKKYCNGANVNKSVTINVDPSNPWVVLSGGSWKFNATSTFVGDGVTLFLTDGAELDINGNADFYLKAPTSGNFSGLAVYIDRDDTGSHKFNGGADITVIGAIYGASADIEVLGNMESSAAGECTQVIGATVTMTGNSDWDTDCTNSGTTEIRTAQTIMLVE